MANSPKYRDFFITLNEDAESYENALEIVKELNFKVYALITHDKDIIVKEDGTTEPKRIHKHLMLELNNPISFASMQKKFKGAHIDIPRYKKSAYQYLIHNSPRSKGTKYQYDTSDIITNDLALVKYTIETETSEVFIQNKFLHYIAEGVRTPYQFVKRFGLDAYKQYWKPFSDMLSQLDTDAEMRHDLDLLLDSTLDDDLPF